MTYNIKFNDSVFFEKPENAKQLFVNFMYDDRRYGI